MKLSKDQQKKIIKKLSNIGKSVCPVCGNKSWEISDAIFEIREFHGGGLVMGAQSGILPIVSLMCDKCGNTQFLNALLLGLVEQPKKEEIEEESQNDLELLDQEDKKEESADQGEGANNE